MPFDYTSDGTPERCLSSLKKNGKLTIAVVGVIAGVALLVFGNRMTGKTADPVPDTPTPGTEIRAVEDYRIALEQRIAAITSEVSGAGSASVVVTLAGGYESVYAYDKKVTVGGESVTYITVGSGADESLVFLCERAPAIVGIGIVCTGGSNPTVKQEVISLVSAAFGVPSSKIYVTGKR